MNRALKFQVVDHDGFQPSVVVEIGGNERPRRTFKHRRIAGPWQTIAAKHPKRVRGIRQSLLNQDLLTAVAIKIRDKQAYVVENSAQVVAVADLNWELVEHSAISPPCIEVGSVVVEVASHSQYLR